MELKGAEGSTSSDVLENGFGVSTAGSAHKGDQSLDTALQSHHRQDIEIIQNARLGPKETLWMVIFLLIHDKVHHKFHPSLFQFGD